MKKIMDNVEVNIEYAAFVWNKERSCYERIGQPADTIALAKKCLQRSVWILFLTTMIRMTLFL